MMRMVEKCGLDMRHVVRQAHHERGWVTGNGVYGQDKGHFTPILTFPHQGGRDFGKIR